MASDQIICPVCRRGVGRHEIAPLTAIDESIKRLLVVNAHGYLPGREVCARCLAQFTRVRDQLAAAYPQFAEQKFRIIPTPKRLDAPDHLRGRGVTIAFLDAGFYAHPDLTEPRDRILKYVNIAGGGRHGDLKAPDVSSWHGMMTSVVAAGNGHLSGGLYRGLAAEANLVLVKVGSASRILHEDIARGLRWVIRNRDRYRIRIVNLSCGGDYEASYLYDELSQAVEAATRAGILVVAATGNAGHHDDHAVLPPASAPSAITIGGLDDRNALDASRYQMYRSSYGPTIDGLQKPEVIAPGIWVAAPILPGTPTAAQAALLSQLEDASDAELRDLIRAHPGVDQELDAAVGLDAYLIRHIVWIKLRDNNVISGHYKHVDGTSFAAPIVASIAAQLLEARPDLLPHEVKHCLIRAAVRIPHIPVDRQGWGVVNPRAAIQMAVGLPRRGAVFQSRQ